MSTENEKCLENGIDGAKCDKIKVYKRRWVNLFLLVLIEAINSMQWIQYSIIANVTMKFYGISAQMVDNTSLVYLITYMPLVLPASWLMDKKGLKYTLVLASVGNCVGCWFKVPSAHPDKFYLGFIGQTILSVVQLLLTSTPPRFAATWFGPKQVSTACSIGVFGQQFGTCLAFLFTPLLVRNSDSIEEIGQDFYNMFLGMAIFSTVVLIAVIIFCEKQPALPPSRAEALIRNSDVKFSNKEFLHSFKRLLRIPSFLLLSTAFGIIIGIFNAIGTLLNQMVLIHFPGDQVFAGQIGLVMMIVGIVGSIVLGYILDKTRKYKETSLLLMVLATLGMASFAFSLGSKSIYLIFLTSAVLGLTSGFCVVAFEYAAEITYPESESSSAGVLNSMAQMGGVVFVLVFGNVLQNFGDFWCNMGLTGCLFISTVIIVFISKDYKRLKLNSGNWNNNTQDSEHGKMLDVK